MALQCPYLASTWFSWPLRPDPELVAQVWKTSLLFPESLNNAIHPKLISSPYLSYLCSKEDKQILSASTLPQAFSLPPKPHLKSKAATFRWGSHTELLNFKQSSFFCKFFCFSELTWVTEYARDSTVVIASTRFTLDLLSRWPVITGNGSDSGCNPSTG